jgi:hypothetical protein
VPTRWLDGPAAAMPYLILFLAFCLLGLLATCALLMQ